MIEPIKLGNKIIGKGFPPFIIAEMSGNHNQSLERALNIVDAAANAGADAIKLQTYTADTITLNSNKKEFTIKNKSSIWSGENLHSLYTKACTPWDWHHEIFKRAKEKGILCFSSPFDETAVDFLEDLDVPAYKIASFENNHIPLIKKVAKTGKPIIISTGMANLNDLELAVNTARENGCKELILLKCTSTYPANPKDSNIKTIPHMRKLFNTQIGLSDHTLGIGVAISAVSLGATVVEKHFTISRKDGGVDSSFSLEPDELEKLVEETNRAWLGLGKVQYGPSESEKDSLMFKRSIYISNEIKKGERFTSKNIRVIRPGYGAPPYLYESLIGKIASRDFQPGTALKLEDLI